MDVGFERLTASADAALVGRPNRVSAEVLLQKVLQARFILRGASWLALPK